jgi:hypothetical protein
MIIAKTVLNLLETKQINSNVISTGDLSHKQHNLGIIIFSVFARFLSFSFDNVHVSLPYRRQVAPNTQVIFLQNPTMLELVW